MLAACAVPEEPPSRDVEVITPVPEQSPSDSKAAPHPPEAKPRPPATLAPSAAPFVELASLVGRGEEDITQILGEPREVRNDPPAMVWNYVVAGCTFDLFFYLDLKSQDFRALAYNFEPSVNTDEAKRACLAKIQEANRDRRR